jgi:hypothetical protein
LQTFLYLCIAHAHTDRGNPAKNSVNGMGALSQITHLQDRVCSPVRHDTIAEPEALKRARQALQYAQGLKSFQLVVLRCGMPQGSSSETACIAACNIKFSQSTPRTPRLEACTRLKFARKHFASHKGAPTAAPRELLTRHAYMHWSYLARSKPIRYAIMILHLHSLRGAREAIQKVMYIEMTPQRLTQVGILRALT